VSSNLRTTLVLRREIASVKDPRELSRLLNPVIGWSGFSPPGPNRPPRLGGFEGDPSWFFDHTFPTKAIKTTISGARTKLDQKAPGILPTRGYLGTGKSHLLLTIYHLFNLASRKHALNWLQRWEIDFKPPEQAILIPIPLQAMKVRNLWEPFFEVLQHETTVAEDDWPKMTEVAAVVKKAGMPVVVLIDELDTWYEAKSSQDQARNRGFIQALADASAQDDVPLITVVVSLGTSEPLKLFLDFAARNVGGSLTILDRLEDILDVVKFRLFEKIDQDIAISIINYYTSLYKGLDIKGLEHISEEMERHYPFHANLFRPLSSAGVRQLLQVLARLVIMNLDACDLLLISDIDDDIVNAFIFQADERLVSAYFDDIKSINEHPDVRSGIIPPELARPFLLTTLLNTMRGGAGATYEDLIFNTLRKKTSKSVIDQTLDFLGQWSRVSREGQKYKFSVELPPPVKITRRAGRIETVEALKKVDEALQRILKKELVGFRVLYGTETLQDEERFRIVVLREPPKDPEAVYKGLRLQNTLLFMYPQQSLTQGQTLWTAKQMIACEELVEEDETKKQQYEKFLAEFLETLESRIREAEWRLLIWSRTSPKEPPKKADAGIPDFKKVKELISRHASKDMIKYFSSLIIEEEKKTTIKEVKTRLQGLRGAPILINYEDFLDSLSDMALEGEIIVRTPQGRTFYKQRVSTDLITDDTSVEKPEIVEHVSIEEAYKLLKEKRTLGFNDLKQAYPVSDEKRVQDVIIQLPKKFEDVYILEEGKIVSTASDVKRARLYSLEKATSLLENQVRALVNDLIAVKNEELLAKTKQEHPGADEKLLEQIVEQLDIAGEIRIDRGKGSVTVPPDKLNEELKRTVKVIVNQKKSIENEDLVKEIGKGIPVDDQIIKNIIAMLCDEGTELECKEGKVSRRIKGRAPPTKPLLFEKEGSAKELASLIESNLKGESLDYAQLSIQNVDASSLKDALESLGETQLKMTARRKA